jgi:hypothetical protein
VEDLATDPELKLEVEFLLRRHKEANRRRTNRGTPSH